MLSSKEFRGYLSTPKGEDSIAKKIMSSLKIKKQCFIRNIGGNSQIKDSRWLSKHCGGTTPESIAFQGAPKKKTLTTLANDQSSNKPILKSPEGSLGAPLVGALEVKNASLHYLNLRFIGVGFRGYILKKIVNIHKLNEEQKKIASRWLDTSEHDGTSFIRILILKLGQSALTAYPIPVGVTIYCPTDQQQQADNQPLLLTSTDYQLLTSVVSEIKSYKIPDVYKGSGVFLCERLETEKGEQYLNETTLRKVIKKK